MRRHELLQVRRTDPVVAAAFAAMDGPASWLSDRGYRTVDGLFETCAVLVRDGLDRHLAPGSTAVLTAALAEASRGTPSTRSPIPGPGGRRTYGASWRRSRRRSPASASSWSAICRTP
ncbi:hypothetical protein ACFT0G_13945 [Streptomyces sp. NPDC057020]|uniref:hypothetical protein n=1 Tax=unclassified Streptomyces TaxID=2593676 RepID=UPI00363BCED4